MWQNRPLLAFTPFYCVFYCCLCWACALASPVTFLTILVPSGRAPFGQHQESRPLARSNTESPWFKDFPSFCASSESSLTNLISSDPNLLCLQSHSKPECRWTRPEVAILGADQKERVLWGREWFLTGDHVMQIGFGQISPSASFTRDLGTRLTAKH